MKVRLLLNGHIYNYIYSLVIALHRKQIGLLLFKRCPYLFSGTDTIPSHEFHPTIVFLHGNSILPTASTCDLELRIPATHSNYVKFRDAMILGLKGHDGFGGI